MNGLDSVCLSGEIFNESVLVRSVVSLYGGFDQNDPDFKFRRKSDVTTTISAVGAAITTETLEGDTQVMGLTINNPCWSMIKAPWLQLAEVVEEPKAA